MDVSNHIISGKTRFIAHIGFPTHSFMAPKILNPCFKLLNKDLEKTGVVVSENAPANSSGTLYATKVMHVPAIPEVISDMPDNSIGFRAGTATETQRNGNPGSGVDGDPSTWDNDDAWRDMSHLRNSDTLNGVANRPVVLTPDLDGFGSISGGPTDGNYVGIVKHGYTLNGTSIGTIGPDNKYYQVISPSISGGSNFPTGTLDDVEVHKLILEGLFGATKKVTSTKELIKEKTLSSISIRCLVLKYNKQECKEVFEMSYQEEIDFLVSHPQRNKYICNLVKGLTGNTLVLFQYIEKHGNILHSILKDIIDPTRKIFFVYGGTDADSREKVRELVEGEQNAIICASYGVYSTGVNIRNIHNIVFASPSKSRIRNLQSIGRGLRKSETKEAATLYDLSDDLTHSERKNYTLNHFMERVKIYTTEHFPYHIYSIPIKGR